MKKIILITFLITSFFYNAFSQIEIGIKGGINVAAVRDLPDGASNRLLLSYNTGLMAQFFLREKFFKRIFTIFY